jgi:spore coat protein CotH
MNLTSMRNSIQFSILGLFALFPFLSAKAQFNNNGDAIFNSTAIHTVKLYFTQTSFWDSLINNYYNDVMMQATVEFNGQLFPSPVGVQLKGNSSFNSYPGVKKSIKISFDEYVDTADLNDITTLNLNNGFKDPSMLREKLCLDFCKKNGINAPRSTFAKVYLNDEFWGFYSLVEQVGKTFCKTRFDNNGGNLYKGDPIGDLRWYGAQESQYYDKYEKKTNEAENWSDLVRLIDNINNEADGVWSDSLRAILNTDQYIRYWATNVLFANLDSYTGSGHNYYIYHDDSLDFFQWIMWDVNEAFGNFNPTGQQNTDLSQLNYDYIPNPATNRPLNNKLLAKPEYRQQLKDQLCAFIQTSFNNWALDPQIDSLANRIRTDYYADPNKMYTNQEFETNLNQSVNQTPGLKSFISSRVSYLSSTLGCQLSAQTPVTNPVKLVPNPFSSSAKLYAETDKVLIFDMLGRSMDSDFDLTKQNGYWTIENKAQVKGCYFVKAGTTTLPFVLE